MTWEMFLIILGWIGTLIIAPIITLVATTKTKRLLEKQLKDQQELLRLQEEKRKEEQIACTKAALRPELEALHKAIDAVAANQEAAVETQTKIIHGTVTLLRERMKVSHDFYQRNGSVSASELASWHELYNTYAELGGNHFKEYVDSWKEEVDSLEHRMK